MLNPYSPEGRTIGYKQRGNRRKVSRWHDPQEADDVEAIDRANVSLELPDLQDSLIQWPCADVSAPTKRWTCSRWAGSEVHERSCSLLFCLIRRCGSPLGRKVTCIGSQRSCKHMVNIRFADKHTHPLRYSSVRSEMNHKILRCVPSAISRYCNGETMKLRSHEPINQIGKATVSQYTLQ